MTQHCRLYVPTVEPAISDHPKYKAKVLAYKRSDHKGSQVCFI